MVFFSYCRLLPLLTLALACEVHLGPPFLNIGILVNGMKALTLTLCRFCVVFLVSLLFIFSYFIATEKSVESPKSSASTTSLIHTNQCPDVLRHTTQGTWRTRPLTPEEDSEIMHFLRDSNTRFRFPANYQRQDGRCGNVVYPSARQFRALCDPKGHTPCCFYNRCMNKNVSECVCEECYDIRQDAHAEYSTWVPSHPACPYRVFSSQEACDLLTGRTLHFVGDSLVRHVYTALLLVIAGDMDYGAINDSVSEGETKPGFCQSH